MQSISLPRQREENEMAEPRDWKSWLPKPNVWKSWMPEPKSWKSWTSVPKGGRSRMSQEKLPNQGVVKRDWVATGRIDFATRLDGDASDANQPSEFKLLVGRTQNCRKHRWKRKSGNSVETCH